MRGWTARVGLRKPGTLAWARSQLSDPHLTSDEWDEFIEYQSAHLTPAQVDAFAPWANDWAGALLGQMRWPGDPDHVDAPAEAMEQPIDHDLINGPLDMLAERQEQRRQSLRAAKAKVDALPADQRARLEGEFQRAEQEAAAIMRRGYPRALPLPVPKREVATYELSDDARPCCHTTGPNHHPACQEER